MAGTQHTTAEGEIRVENIYVQEFEPWPQQLEVLEGYPEWLSCTLWSARDGRSVTGLWQGSVGKYVWEFTWDETGVVFEGRVIVTADGCDPIELKAGDVFSFPSGVRTIWEVVEPLRKLWHGDSDEPIEL